MSWSETMASTSPAVISFSASWAECEVRMLKGLCRRERWSAATTEGSSSTNRTVHFFMTWLLATCALTWRIIGLTECLVGDYAHPEGFTQAAGGGVVPNALEHKGAQDVSLSEEGAPVSGLQCAGQQHANSQFRELHGLLLVQLDVRGER